MIENAGKYNQKISIVSVTTTRNENGFPVTTETVVLSPWAEVKTTKGMTLIANGSDFEKAYTRFTIRFPLTVITRDMLVKFKGKTYTIEYLNDIDEAGIELELQCKEVTH